MKREEQTSSGDHERRVERLKSELERVRRKPLARCPACLHQVGFDDQYVRVNGCYVHTACARGGEYAHVPVGDVAC